MSQPDLPESIYRLLALHQRTEEWHGRDLIAKLQTWADLFNAHFNLHVSYITLRIDRLPVSYLGHYRRGPNGQGLKGEIAINTRYLNGTLAMWQILGVELHELLHGWEYERGTASPRQHHNAIFREKAASLGLIVSSRGVTDYAAASPFKDLLRANGVDVPDGEQLSPTRRIVGKSNLAKWSCACGSIRCGRARINLRCFDCGTVLYRDQALKAG